jgi:hypothetical protein
MMYCEQHHRKYIGIKGGPHPIINSQQLKHEYLDDELG